MRWPGSTVTVLLVTWCLTGAPARADDATAAAQTHVDRGKAFSDAGNFADALAEFEAAYELVRSPKLLYNMAQIERRLGKTDEARAHYEAFVREVGAAPEGSELEAKVRIAREAIGELGGDPSPQPSPRQAGRGGAEGGTASSVPVAPPPLPTPGPSPREAGRGVGEGSAITLTVPLPRPEPTPPAKPPLYKRWYFWTAVGAVLIAGGGAAFLLRDQRPDCRPQADVCIR
jgi:tetratricopeptide (TPR) repeat protein